MYGSNDNPSIPETAPEAHAYVVKSGSTGPRPTWWDLCAPTTREDALNKWHHLVELTPECGPHGNRRLKVVEVVTP